MSGNQSPNTQAGSNGGGDGTPIGSLPRPKSWNGGNRTNNNQQGGGGAQRGVSRGGGRGGGRGAGRGGNNNQTQDNAWDMPRTYGNNNNNRNNGSSNGNNNFQVQGPTNNYNNNSNINNNNNNNNMPVSNMNGPTNSGGDITRAFCVCEFKRNRYRKYECPHHITTGQYVIVDGDRGQDCGLVVQVSRFMRDGSVQQHDMDGTDLENFNAPKMPKNGRVQRLADAAEIDSLHTKIADKEQHALNTCRERCVELGLVVDVIDCEYQFDCKKVSFFFDSETSVDFRELCKDLFRVFNARIWMENINTNVRNVLPAGATASNKSRSAKAQGSHNYQQKSGMSGTASG